MFWYGPSPLFLLSVMTLNDVEGFRGSASVRSGLFQVGKVSAKIMKTQPMGLTRYVERPYQSKVGSAKLEGATAACAVRFGARPSVPECVMTSGCFLAGAFVGTTTSGDPGTTVTSELLGMEDTLTITSEMDSQVSESRFWLVLDPPEGQPDPVDRRLGGDTDLVSSKGTPTCSGMESMDQLDGWPFSMPSRGALTTVGALLVLPLIVASKGRSQVLSKNNNLLVLGGVLTSLVHTEAVCVHCKDTIAGCAGGANCPLVMDLSENVAIFTTNRMDARPKVSLLMVQEMAQTFTRVITDAVVGLANAPAPGTEVDLTAGAYNTPSAIVRAASCGHCSLREAGQELQRRIDEATEILDIEKLRSAQRSIADFGQELDAESQGVLAFIWAKVSSTVTSRRSSAVKLDLGGAKAKASSLVASISRPTSEGQFYEMLHYLVMVITALGLASPFIIMRFVDDVAYGAVRLGESFAVAFELITVYLTRIDSDNTRTLTLATIFRHGGQDTFMAEARRKEAFFRPPQLAAAPGGGTKAQVVVETDSNGVRYNRAAKRACRAYNTGEACTDLDGNGVCKYTHRCDQWVLDKGKFGTCGGSHAKCHGCSYAEDKKSDTPVRK